MRTEVFKMERPNLVKAGDRVEITERPGASGYSYIINPAVAMSGCYPSKERILNTSGTVKEIQENDRGFYVVVEFT